MSNEQLYHYNDTIKYVETTEPDKVAEYIDQIQQENKQLKKELANWKDGTIICNYEKQLAEKDKEIERLNKIKVPEKVVAVQNDVEMTTEINGVKFNIDQLDIINNLRLIQTQPEVQKQLRHEICEEIRKELNDEDHFAFGYLTQKEINKVIDQIKGE